MFIKFNYRCPHCGHEEERFIKKEVMDKQWCSNRGLPCHDDGELLPMTRLPAAPVTTFRHADRRLKP
jgi:hypothetical protein